MNALTKPIQKELKQTFEDYFGAKAAAKLRKELSFIDQILLGNTFLAKSTPQSLGNAVKSAAALDLSFDPTLNHLYMVPYKDSKTGMIRANLQVGYKGRIFYLTREGVILRAVVETVCQNDTFDYEDSQSGFKWKFKKPLNQARGNIIGSFCAYELPNGKWHGGFFNMQEIGIREKASKSRDKFWQGDYRPEMIMKTACRMATKGLPYGPALAALDDVDNQHFDMESLNLTEERGKEIAESIRGCNDVASLNRVYADLPKYEKTHYKVVDLFKTAKERIKNTVEV